MVLFGRARFRGIKFVCPPHPMDAPCAPSGDAVLNALGFNSSDIPESLAVLAGMCIVCNFVAFFVLVFNGPKYARS